jgi:DNA invertase Pin-like site-specific DNA recombinase
VANAGLYGPAVANVIGYTRVSSQGQVDDGLGLEVQEEAIRRWCAEQGHRVVALYRDEGVSGTVDGIDRPALGAALSMLEDGAGDTLVVVRLDRLARDLIIQETMIQRLGLHDCQVVSVTEPDIMGSEPTRVLVRQLLGAISQYERVVIAGRMAAGRLAKAARGGYAGYGSPRFGWKSDGDRLVPDASEQETMARIIELHRQGLSLREIVAALTAERRTSKRGGAWHPKTVARVIERVEDVGAAAFLPTSGRAAA